MQKSYCTKKKTRIYRIGRRKKHGKDEKGKKKKVLLANWEGLYAFVKYKDQKGCKEFDDGCILKGIIGKQWERARCDQQMLN
jgi:hypothetical protein